MRHLALIGMTLALVACDVAVVPAGDTLAAGSTPSERSLYLETTGCGNASGRTGSAVLWDDGRAITAAHLVAQADEVTLDGTAATVAALDLTTDLALLDVPGLSAPPVRTGLADEGAAGRIVGAATSGTLGFEVLTVANLSIEEVLGTARHSRLGYELAATTAGGDSGAGAWDDQDRLIGMVFASAGDRTWVTAAAEVIEFLAQPQLAHECDPSRSRQVAS